MKIYTLAFKRLCSDMIEMGCTNIPRHLETYNRQSSPYFQLKDRFQLHMRKASDGSRGVKHNSFYESSRWWTVMVRVSRFFLFISYFVYVSQGSFFCQIERWRRQEIDPTHRKNQFLKKRIHCPRVVTRQILLPNWVKLTSTRIFGTF